MIPMSRVQVLQEVIDVLLSAEGVGFEYATELPENVRVGHLLDCAETSGILGGQLKKSTNRRETPRSEKQANKLFPHLTHPE